MERSDMKLVGGLWMPEHEHHMVEWMQSPKNKVLVDGKLTYQWKKQVLAMTFVQKWRVAVDVGAHCGFWSMHLAQRFRTVHAFEPIELHRACWEANVTTKINEAILHPCALGEEDSTCAMFTTPHSSGGSYVQGKGSIPIKRLDGYDFQDVDFIKLDCEGFELFALRGGQETLKRCKPAIIVEQKPGRAPKYGLAERDAIPYLQGLGAKLRREMGGDFFFTWD